VSGGWDLAGCLARIAEREPAIRAWAYRPDRLPDPVPGPLAGLPVGVKDVIDTADMPTECGSAVHRGRRPAEDAACVALLRRAGAIVVGKTVTTELASFAPGPTRNPHAPTHTPGGSSSGSAAAVAAGMVPVALGTQTAASVVRPASFCGIVGYSASWGELPMRGVNPLAPGLDTLGVLAREVADAALVRAALVGAPRVPAQAPAAPWLALWASPALEPSMRDALTGAADALAVAGAEILTLDGAGAIVEELTALHLTVMGFELARTLAWEDDRRALLHPKLVAQIDEGLAVGIEEVHAARARVQELGAALHARLDGCDAVLAAGANGPAPEGLDSTGDPHQSRAWHVLGLPAVALPAGVDEHGLPLGVQLVGRRFGDDALLALAAWAAAALPEPPAPRYARSSA
jgi:Asp-tRNA(Asn)/Glu-tRNA(Gln) amidotransferase A subunit family amidase